MEQISEAAKGWNKQISIRSPCRSSKPVKASDIRGTRNNCLIRYISSELSSLRKHASLDWIGDLLIFFE